ncbi:MAG: hypothetical protein KC546_10690 [Anaerolineae bacterium]|nr:hypothetical protein [Anaerolineae bacterium]MCA9888832.1 hypothetical protein [Anaerolineae bacterium]MCA9891460.1 hypothetical protein [Anaerolineae bacterium]
MKKHALVCNLLFKLDNGKSRRYMVDMLKYLQFREDRNQPAPQVSRNRWVDRGLGRHYKAITKSLTEMAKDHTNRDEVLLRMMVVSPHPNLMKHLPASRRRRVLHQLTESMMENFFTSQNLSVPEYSYVIHDPQTDDDNQRLHSHVIFPATTPDMDGRRHYDIRRKQMPQFHKERDRTITQVLSRYLGTERVVEIDNDLLTDAEKEAREKAKTIPNDINDLNQWFDMR